MGRQRRNPGGAGRRASSKAKQKKAAAQARALASGKERARTAEGQQGIAAALEEAFPMLEGGLIRIIVAECTDKEGSMNIDKALSSLQQLADQVPHGEPTQGGGESSASGRAVEEVLSSSDEDDEDLRRALAESIRESNTPHNIPHNTPYDAVHREAATTSGLGQSSSGAGNSLPDRQPRSRWPDGEGPRGDVDDDEDLRRALALSLNESARSVPASDPGSGSGLGLGLGFEASAGAEALRAIRQTAASLAPYPPQQHQPQQQPLPPQQQFIHRESDTCSSSGAARGVSGADAGWEEVQVQRRSPIQTGGASPLTFKQHLLRLQAMHRQYRSAFLDSLLPPTWPDKSPESRALCWWPRVADNAWWRG
eukprot:CAMPEP_0114289484 /NCGR_PEP_ID=MMETSP0059-20121206/7403_1 /TAXON_ID=36894 /ORGANISM="Pyramimonas parkeae, Strain CCMP726" /LENGTH=366 /DNA_ID=CAMNT_0001410769 /DNA_START=153 /DNA_END=1249 /DNA_ORIENTATION=+